MVEMLRDFNLDEFPEWDKANSVDTFRDIARSRRKALLETWTNPPGRFGNVTALVYFFREPKVADSFFELLETAILQTWLNCGMMKTVIVTDSPCKEMLAFAVRFCKWIEIQQEKRLVAGDINSMSIDCIARLHARFSTPYVLIVQDDGFPIRPGLEEFIGKYDYIGAPLRLNHPLVLMLQFFLRSWPSNGGFSLRSRRICEAAAEYYRRDWAGKPFSQDLIEDMFYTRTLPKTYFRFRYGYKIADSRSSSRFSFSDLRQNFNGRMPFGFHNARSFLYLARQGVLNW